jgi:hypothetical protein
MGEILDRPGSAPAYAVGAPPRPTVAATSAAGSRTGRGQAARTTSAGPIAASPARSPGHFGPAQAGEHFRHHIQLLRGIREDRLSGQQHVQQRLVQLAAGSAGKGGPRHLIGRNARPAHGVTPPGSWWRVAAEDRGARPPTPRPGSLPTMRATAACPRHVSRHADLSLTRGQRRDQRQQSLRRDPFQRDVGGVRAAGRSAARRGALDRGHLFARPLAGRAIRAGAPAPGAEGSAPRPVCTLVTSNEPRIHQAHTRQGCTADLRGSPAAPSCSVTDHRRGRTPYRSALWEWR